jgi:glycosyltransferase involved in cell wall biosynthesis
MARVGLCHYKVGGTDGVSLEMDKWKAALERLGHQAVLGGGDLGTTEGYKIEELYHHRPDTERIRLNAFKALEDWSEEELVGEILALANRIEEKLREFLDRCSIDVLVPNNIWSLDGNLAAAIAFSRVVRAKGIPAVGHHHDFFWEWFRDSRPSCQAVSRLVEEVLPPKGEGIKHLVINKIAQGQLQRRRELPAQVVPNVFDFSSPRWEVDDYSRDFRDRIGVDERDVLVLQATRVVTRKGIELAIDLVAELSQPRYLSQLRRAGLYDGRPFGPRSRIVLVLAGYSEDPSGEYLERLKRKAEAAGIEIRYISELVRAKRTYEDGEKRYSLWDCYAHADLVTYPSYWEGWGNQFLEAVFARLPLVMFEYPVYKTDIKGKGFRVISLGDKIAGRDELGLVRVDREALCRAAQGAVQALTAPSERQRMVEHNFRLGQEHYSLESLEECITRALGDYLGS